jgi:hypothetical protein
MQLFELRRRVNPAKSRELVKFDYSFNQANIRLNDYQTNPIVRGGEKMW